MPRLYFRETRSGAQLITVLETDAGELPLLHAMEERAGERRSQAIEPEDAGLAVVSFLKSPSPALSPLLPRGEREMQNKNSVKMHHVKRKT